MERERMNMKNQASQQMFLDFNREFAGVTVTGDMITINVSSQKSLELAKEKKIPLINLCPPRIKPSDFFAVLNKVAGIVRKYKPELKDELSGFLAALPGEVEAQELFVSQAFTPGANLTEKIEGDISPETLTFLLSHTVKPFMKEYGRIMSSYYDPEQWLKGTCPVCGGKPTFSLLNKDAGTRYLYCGLCEVKWHYRRLGCPYCGDNESQFFTVEGLEKYRVYFCDKCRGYIKTINGKILSESYLANDSLDLFWEDVNTVQLDLLAMQEGYFNQRVD
jgi:FdhE protein